MTKDKNKPQTLRHNIYKTRKNRKRDYKLEYVRRIKKGLAAGKSPSLARGHRTASEALFEPNRLKPIKDRDFNRAFKEYEKTKSFRKAAHKIGVSPERFRNQAFARKLIKQEGKHWAVISVYPKTVPIFSEGQRLDIEVADFKTASKVGKYMNAVRNFLRSQNPEYLTKFIGRSVKDTKGKTHVFEADKNTLYRLTRSSAEPIDFYDHS